MSKKKQALPELFTSSFNLGNRRLLGDCISPPRSAEEEKAAQEALAKLDEALKSASAMERVYCPTGVGGGIDPNLFTAYGWAVWKQKGLVE